MMVECGKESLNGSIHKTWEHGERMNERDLNNKIWKIIIFNGWMCKRVEE